MDPLKACPCSRKVIKMGVQTKAETGREKRSVSEDVSPRLLLKRQTAREPSSRGRESSRKADSM